MKAKPKNQNMTMRHTVILQKVKIAIKSTQSREIMQYTLLSPNRQLLTETMIRMMTHWRQQFNFAHKQQQSWDTLKYHDSILKLFCSQHFLKNLLPLWMTSYFLRHCFWDLSPVKEGALGRDFPSTYQSHVSIFSWQHPWWMRNKYRNT